jgi:hypothetical protein
VGRQSKPTVLLTRRLWRATRPGPPGRILRSRKQPIEHYGCERTHHLIVHYARGLVTQSRIHQNNVCRVPDPPDMGTHEYGPYAVRAWIGDRTVHSNILDT